MYPSIKFSGSRYLCLAIGFFLLINTKSQMLPDSKEQVLHDGRELSYREYGDLDGKPIFYFHGFPSSGIEMMLDDCKQIASELNLRVIAVNRPGYGNSGFKADRQLLDWPDDISELADSLALDKFSVMGVSGGCPYAIVCAFKIPDRLVHVGIISGLGPYGAPGVKKSAASPIVKLPRFVRKMILKGFKKVLEKNPDKVARKMKKRFPPSDQAVMAVTAERDVLLDALKEGLSAGPEGAMQDTEIYKNDWGFELKAVHKKLFLWHGEDDLSVPVETGRYMAGEFPNCTATFYAGEGHFSLLYNKANEIFGVLSGE